MAVGGGTYMADGERENGAMVREREDSGSDGAEDQGGTAGFRVCVKMA